MLHHWAGIGHRADIGRPGVVCRGFAAGTPTQHLRQCRHGIALDASGVGQRRKVGNHRRKAMVWEVWDRLSRKIIWLISGSVLNRPSTRLGKTFLPFDDTIISFLRPVMYT